MMGLTHSSEDKDCDTVIATNRMPMHIKFSLPEFYTTSVLQKGAATLGSAMKADWPYGKEELDHYYTTVSTPNTWMNAFTIIVQVPPPANTTSPTTLTSCILCGAIRPANDFIWPFTGISLNEDGLFNTHSPDMQMMELAILNAMESIATWAGGSNISARDIQQHKPLV